MKEFIIENWALIIGVIVFVFGIVYTIVKQPQKIKEWLLWAVSEAEAKLGSGTGQLKLREVYDKFTSKYPVISLFVPFNTFSMWVDEALDEMRKLIENNKAINDYIKGGE